MDVMAATRVDVDVKAPGVIKLFGEHAAAYGKLGVAAAIDMYASVSVKNTPSRELWIILPDLDNIMMPFHPGKLELLYESYTSRSSQENYIKENLDIDVRLLPFATIAAKLAFEFNIDVFGKEVRVSSRIPIHGGVSSSTACSAAFAVGMTRSLGPVTGGAVADAVMMEMAREGEKVAHIYEGVGKLDVLASYYGGYVSTTDGGRKEGITGAIKMVLINSGPKRSTAETVGAVRKLYTDKTEDTELILENINKCSINGLDAISGGDIKRAGLLMSQNHDLLKELGISNVNLDKAVELAKSHGAYGAKLEDGGGMVIALGENPEALASAMQAEGYTTYLTSVSFDGANRFLQ